MRLAGIGAIVALGAMLATPVYAQAPTTPTMPTMPSVRPPTVTPPSVTMPQMPSATRPAAPAMPMGSPAMRPSAATMAPVDINSASAAELDKVKYIGPKRAAKIIAGRPWTSADDLVTKKVLPQKTYDKIKDRLMVK